jgi:hypothetical protein
LLRDGRVFPTPSAAHQGWVSPRLDGTVDWSGSNLTIGF